MSPYWEKQAEFLVAEIDDPIRIQFEEMEEANRRLKQDLLRQQEIAQQLAERVRELEPHKLESSAVCDQTLPELEERNRIESILCQKTKELARSNQDLEQFASLAAHDLQEPLHTIQVFADLLRVRHGSLLNDQGSGYLDRVTKAAHRMQQLIEGLLLYSRIDAPSSRDASISLQQIVQEILSDLGAQIEELRAEVHVGDLPVIHGDALHIRQLLQNLIGNALKFHKQGIAPVIHMTGKTIQDRRHTGTGKAGNLCQIEIHDQGIGISTKHLDKIFGMFKRLHRKDEYEGTGLGLAVCQRITDQCGGAISVRSTVGKGTTFTVTLPAWGKSGS
jgi:light-regulated signal transduction histidine kinase (bacteriophytochrome)